MVRFFDNFLEMEYDLSKVLFIATANTLSTISPALRDRMELIEITGYLVEEKLEIAKQHLLPKQLENHGVKPEQLVINKKVMELVIEKYSRESGVRELDKKLAKIVRVTAKKYCVRIRLYSGTLTRNPAGNSRTSEIYKRYLRRK